MANRDYTIAGPDGREVTITGPDNATPEQIRQAAEQAFARAPKVLILSFPRSGSSWLGDELGYLPGQLDLHLSPA